VRKLSNRERRALREKLAPRHEEFLGDVEPIMLAPEIDAFLTLESDENRDAFIEEFWRRRAALHRGGTMSFRDVYYQRLEIAKREFNRANSDRARTYLLQGPPDAVVRADCRQLLQPIEIWKYERLPALGHPVHLLFYRSRQHNDYVLWNPLGGNMAMAELLRTTADDIAEQGARSRTGELRSESPYKCARSCVRW
jgi:GWxTD domain-containing protein